MKSPRYKILTSLIYTAIFGVLFTQLLAAQNQALMEGMKWYEMGEYEQAATELQKVIELQPPDAQAYLLLISSLLELRQPGQAENYAADAVKQFPEMPVFNWLNGEALLNQDKLVKALESYSETEKKLNQGQIITSFPISQDQVTLRKGQINQMLAVREYQNGGTDRAVQYLEQAVHHLGDSVQVHKQLVSLLLENKQYDEALRAIDTAQNQFPEDADLIRMKASAYYQLEDHESLLSEYETIYRKNPDKVENGLIYAELLLANRRSNEGVELLLDMTDRFPEEQKIYEMLLSVYEQRFDMEGKRVILRKMIQQFPNEPDYALEIAKTYEIEENWQEARAVYDSLVTVSDEILQYQMAKAQTYERQDSLAKALEVYQTITEQFPRESEPHFRIGWIYEAREQWKQATKSYQKSIKYDEDDRSEYQIRYGVAAMNTGDYSVAEENFTSAISRKSKSPEPWFYLSKLKYQNDKKAEALVLAKTSLRKSLEELESRQQILKSDIQEEGFFKQAGRDNELDELEGLNQLTVEIFNWFTGHFEFTDTEPVLLNIVNQFKTSGRLHYLLGNFYLENHQKNEARTYFEDAVRFTPGLVQAHLKLGEIFEGNGQNQEAIRAYERVTSLDKKMPGSYKALIRLHQKEGSLDQLCDQWLFRFRSNPESEILKSHLIEALHKANRFDQARSISNR